MRSFQLILLCFICVTKSYGQVTNSYRKVVVEIIKKRSNISSNVEMIGFAEGDSSWIQSLNKNINETFQDGKGIKKENTLLLSSLLSLKMAVCPILVAKTIPGLESVEK
jgi:hypothetical protein